MFGLGFVALKPVLRILMALALYLAIYFVMAFCLFLLSDDRSFANEISTPIGFWLWFDMWYKRLALYSRGRLASLWRSHMLIQCFVMVAYLIAVLQRPTHFEIYSDPWETGEAWINLWAALTVVNLSVFIIRFVWPWLKAAFEDDEDTPSVRL